MKLITDEGKELKLIKESRGEFISFNGRVGVITSFKAEDDNKRYRIEIRETK